MLNGIQHLTLQNFRNYSLIKHDFHRPVVILTGANGAGKTNILEALSLLTPGKGLRNCKLGQITRHGSAHPWILSTELNSDGLENQIGSTLEFSAQGTEKRLIRINQSPTKSQNELNQWLSVVWMVPAMARIFQESGGIRRKFIDRMITALDPLHSERLHRYEHYLRERSILLKEQRFEAQWLASLEEKIAADGIAIIYSRDQFVRQLNLYQPQDSASPFPRFFAQMRGACEDWTRNSTAIVAEEKLRQALKESRAQDAITGGAHFGPHRSDLHVDHLAKQMPAELCSTGEQKILLLALFLAFVKIQEQHNERITLVLLDDVIAHLDEQHRIYLFDELMRAIQDGIKIQIWMTGTSATDFAHLKEQAQFVQAINSTLIDGYEDNDSPK